MRDRSQRRLRGHGLLVVDEPGCGRGPREPAEPADDGDASQRERAENRHDEERLARFVAVEGDERDGREHEGVEEKPRDDSTAPIRLGEDPPDRKSERDRG